MNPINEAHVSEPGLVVVDIAAADDATALAFQHLLADRWATSPAQHTTRDAGELGVRLRCYLDLRQPISPAAPADGLPPASAAAPR
ncbi:DUF6207 family protein [Streptomyces griseoincarnatus]